MYDFLLSLSLILSFLSLATIGMICRCCRRMRREKERSIAQAVCEQERLIRELILLRNEKQRLRQVLKAKLPAWDSSATRARSDAAPQRFDTPYNI